MAKFAMTFQEYIDIMATNSPHATVMDWWRRLSLAIDDYFKILDEPRGSASEVESRISSNPKLGSLVATNLRELRLTRNRVAHENVATLTAEQAIEYAKSAFELGWTIIRAGSY